MKYLKTAPKKIIINIFIIYIFISIDILCDMAQNRQVEIVPLKGADSLNGN